MGGLVSFVLVLGFLSFLFPLEALTLALFASGLFKFGRKKTQCTEESLFFFFLSHEILLGLS